MKMDRPLKHCIEAGSVFCFTCRWIPCGRRRRWGCLLIVWGRLWHRESVGMVANHRCFIITSFLPLGFEQVRQRSVAINSIPGLPVVIRRCGHGDVDGDGFVRGRQREDAAPLHFEHIKERLRCVWIEEHQPDRAGTWNVHERDEPAG